jgi:hypothetical protein
MEVGNFSDFGFMNSVLQVVAGGCYNPSIHLWVLPASGKVMLCV